MIKKILLSLGLVGLSLISFANAECTINNLILDGVYKNGYMHSSIGSNAFDIGITSKGTVISQSFGIGKNVFAFDDYHMFWWDINGNPYLYYSGTTQGYFQYYGVCDELTASSTGAVNCSKIAYDPENSKPLIQSFLSTTTVNDYYGYRYYKDGNNYHYYVHVCFSSHEIGKSLCFKYYRCTYNVDCRANNCNLTGNLGYSKLTFASIPYSIIGQSPGLNGGNSGGGDLSDGGVELGSSESAILYFESRYGWDKSICYAGIDNLTAVYGDPVSFQEGTGLSIFQVFSGLYGNSDLNKVYVWLNSRLINYDQWYERSEPLYLSSYNSGSNQVDLYYTGFTFPFANNPVAIFFLTDNLYNRSTYKSQGSEIVSYCNLKINNGTFDEIIDQSVKENINSDTQLVNINKGLNPDGSRREFDNVGAFLTSGTDLAFSGNTTIKNTLKNFFEDMDQSLSIVDIDTSYRILPTWLVTAFLFVVLFKLLRKR